MDIIKIILLHTEGEAVDLSVFSEKELVYHSALLIDAGLVHGSAIKNANGEVVTCIIQRLTWDGHDFLDSARNESAWSEAGNIAKQKGLSLPFDLLKELLGSIIRGQIMS